MLGQVNTPRRRALALAAIIVAVLSVPAVSLAKRAHSVSTLRAQDAAIEAKSRAAVLGLYSLDVKLAASRTQLASLERQSAALRAQRAVLRTQLAVARRSTRVAQAHIAQRIRELYEDGNVEPLEIVLGSTSLDDALTNLDNLSRVSSQSEAVLGELKTARARTSSDQRALATRETALDEALREAVATEASLEAARAGRSAYIASLATARRLNQEQISALVARAQAAQLRSAQLGSRATDVSDSSGPGFSPTDAGPVPDGRAITVSATGYSLGGRTASGLPVGWGIAAVDPSVIPLGTHMWVPGYGEAVAADTGGAVVGARIDLWFPTVAQADDWGRRTVTIVLH